MREACPREGAVVSFIDTVLLGRRLHAGHRRGMTIAAAIVMHSLAEGLTIGVSARTGAIALATVLLRAGRRRDHLCGGRDLGGGASLRTAPAGPGMLAGGFLIGIATDLVVNYGGG